MECGTHDFLMEKNGMYFNLVNAQMKQENDEDNENDLLESDEEIMKYNIDDKNMSIKRQSSIKVKWYIIVVSFYI